MLQDLLPFFQLIAGLSFAPAIFSKIFEWYSHDISKTVKSHIHKLKDSLNEIVDNILNAIEYTPLSIVLSEEELESLNKKYNDTVKHFSNPLKKVYETEFITTSKLITESYDKKVKKILEIVKLSLIINGIYATSILLFVPIYKHLLCDLYVYSIQMLLIYLFLSVLTTQIIIYLKNKEKFTLPIKILFYSIIIASIFIFYNSKHINVYMPNIMSYLVIVTLLLLILPFIYYLYKIEKCNKKLHNDIISLKELKIYQFEQSLAIKTNNK